MLAACNLYEEKCKSDNIVPVSSKVYRTTFCTEYNLSFHKPTKDTCAFCNTYQEKEHTGVVSEEDKINYAEHLKRKDEARSEKEKDKEASKQEKSIYTATFDLQAVLYTLCSNVSKAFYKRKLNCYNLTIFSLADKSGSCYIWDETNGQRGSSEIGSCLITLLKSLPSIVKHVILYSDCCSGQNRNQYRAAGLHHTVKASPSLEILEQKFLESGHTQMECDSMHSATEHAKKGTSIYHPDQWDTAIHMARRNKPYVVVPMRYNNFKDLKSFTKEEYSGMKTDTEGNKINWMRIKVIRVVKESSDEMQIKESFTDQQFRSIRIRQTRGRPSDTPKAIPNKY